MAKLARSSMVQFGAQIVQTVVGFLATLYFAQTLGSAPLGKYFLALAIVNWLLVPNSGIQTATMKRVSEREAEDRYFTAGTAMQLALIGVTVTGLVILRDQVNAYTGFDAALLVAAALATKALTNHLLSTLRAVKKLDTAGLVEGGWHTTRPVVQFVFITTGAGVLGLMWGEIVAAMIAIVASATVLGVRFRRPSRRHFRRIYDYGRYTAVTAIKTRTFSWMDTIILGFFVVPGVVGVYEVAWRVTAAFVLLAAAMAKVVFPHMSERAAANDLTGVSETLNRALTFGGLLAIPGIVGAATVGYEVLALYGPEFTAGVAFLIILALARALQSYEMLLIGALNALDLPEITFRITLIFTVINVGMNIILISTLGPIGAAVATAISTLISGGLALREVTHRIPVSIDRRPLVAQVLSAGLMGAVVVALKQGVRTESVVATLALVGVGTAVYFAAVFTASPQLRRRLQSVLPGV